MVALSKLTALLLSLILVLPSPSWALRQTGVEETDGPGKSKAQLIAALTTPAVPVPSMAYGPLVLPPASPAAGAEEPVRFARRVPRFLGRLLGFALLGTFALSMPSDHRLSPVAPVQFPPLPKGPSPFLFRPVAQSSFFSEMTDRQKEFPPRMTWYTPDVSLDVRVLEVQGMKPPENPLEKYGLGSWRTLLAEMEERVFKDDQFTRYLEAGNVVRYVFEASPDVYPKEGAVFKEAEALSSRLSGYFHVRLEKIEAVFSETERREILRKGRELDSLFSFLVVDGLIDSVEKRVGVFTDRNKKEHFYDPSFVKQVRDYLRISRLSMDDLKALDPAAARPRITRMAKQLIRERELLDRLTGPGKLFLPEGLRQEMSAHYWDGVDSLVRKSENPAPWERAPVLVAIIEDHPQKLAHPGLAHAKHVENHLRRHAGETLITGFHYPLMDHLRQHHGYHRIQFLRAARAGVDVVNFSWCFKDDAVMTESDRAIFSWSAKRVLIIAASGNQGRDKVGFPASLPDVWSVGVKINTSQGWVNTWYSNWSPELKFSVPVEQIDPKNAGTSLGAPVITAQVVQELSLNPAATRQEVRQALLRKGYRPPATPAREPRPKWADAAEKKVSYFYRKVSGRMPEQVDLSPWVLPLAERKQPLKDILADLWRVALDDRVRQTAGEEEIKFYDGYTEKDSGKVAAGLEGLVGRGLVQPNERRAVVSMGSARDLNSARVFIRDDLPEKEIPGVQTIRFPVNPAEARDVLQGFRPQANDLILLPLMVEAGSENAYRPAGSEETPIVVTSATGLEEATSQELAALARIARNLKRQVLRVGLEEWSRRVIDRDQNNLSIQY